MFVLITISNTRSERVNENITRQCTRQEENMYTCKFSCLLDFQLLRYCSSTGRRRRSRRRRCNSVKISITCITPVLQAILDFFPDIISFQHVFHLGVGRSQIEWKLKAKTQISVFPWAKIGQNDHSNPYIESTTVLSDILRKYF